MILNLIPKIVIFYAFGAHAVFLSAMFFGFFDEKDKIPQKAVLSWVGFFMLLITVYKRRGTHEKD